MTTPLSSHVKTSPSLPYLENFPIQKLYDRQCFTIVCNNSRLVLLFQSLLWFNLPWFSILQKWSSQPLAGAVNRRER